MSEARSADYWEKDLAVSATSATSAATDTALATSRIIIRRLHSPRVVPHTPLPTNSPVTARKLARQVLMQAEAAMALDLAKTSRTILPSISPDIALTLSVIEEVILARQTSPMAAFSARGVAASTPLATQPVTAARAHLVARAHSVPRANSAARVHTVAGAHSVA